MDLGGKKSTNFLELYKVRVGYKIWNRDIK